MRVLALGDVGEQAGEDLLRRPGVTVATAARKVGYADPFGFSAAFKRVRGVPPSQVAVAPTAPTPTLLERSGGPGG